jgi:hypothetical protein
MRGVLLHYLYRPDPQVKPEPFQATMSLEDADKIIIEVSDFIHCEARVNLSESLTIVVVGCGG